MSMAFVTIKIKNQNNNFQILYVFMIGYFRLWYYVTYLKGYQWED